MKVLQLPLETLGITEGETEGRHLAQVVSRVELYLSYPGSKKLAAQILRPPPRHLAVVGTVD